MFFQMCCVPCKLNPSSTAHNAVLVVCAFQVTNVHILLPLHFKGVFLRMLFDLSDMIVLKSRFFTKVHRNQSCSLEYMLFHSLPDQAGAICKHKSSYFLQQGS